MFDLAKHYRELAADYSKAAAKARVGKLLTEKQCDALLREAVSMTIMADRIENTPVSVSV